MGTHLAAAIVGPGTSPARPFPSVDTAPHCSLQVSAVSGLGQHDLDIGLRGREHGSPPETQQAVPRLFVDTQGSETMAPRGGTKMLYVIWGPLSGSVGFPSHKPSWNALSLYVFCCRR